MALGWRSILDRLCWKDVILVWLLCVMATIEVTNGSLVL